MSRENSLTQREIDVDGLVERIRERTLKGPPKPGPKIESEIGTECYLSSDYNSVREAADQQKQTLSTVKPVRKPGASIKTRKKSQAQLPIRSNNVRPARLAFASEMEFFLHHMWSDLAIEVDMDDLDVQSQALTAHPSSAAGTKRSQSSQLVVKNDRRVPMSFNFQIVETLTVRNGQIQRWYYSDEMGHIKIREIESHEQWAKLFQGEGRNEFNQKTTPGLVTYRLEDETSDSIISKDIMSLQRAHQLAKSYTEADGQLPQNVHLVQQMLQSADLTKPIAHAPPKTVKIKNISETHQVYECHYNRAMRHLNIFKLTNLLQKSQIQIAQNRNTMTALMKPIRLKHGNPNQSKAELLKLQVPIQTLYLSFEEGQTFCERKQIYPNEHGLRRLNQVQNGSSSLKTNAKDLYRRLSQLQGINYDSVSQQNRASTTSTQSNEKSYQQQLSDELEKEVRAALELIYAQFQIQNKSLQSGVFYFQWVHTEPTELREPTKAVSKQLYLVQVKNLHIVDKHDKQLVIPNQRILQHKDSLTSCFFDLIYEHALDRQLHEHTHTDVCSCKIQIDLQPRIKPMLLEMYARLEASDPLRHRLSKMQGTILEAFGYMFGIDEQVRTALQNQRKEIKDDEQMKKKRQRQMYFVYEEDQADCAFCSQATAKHSCSLPLMYLLYMPQQEQFLESLGEKLPQACRERLLLSNKELPPFLRLLIPSVETTTQYKKLQLSDDWLYQEIRLSQDCYDVLAAQIAYLAEQSDRLDYVQSKFQAKMLKILKPDEKDQLQLKQFLGQSPQKCKQTLQRAVRQSKAFKQFMSRVQEIGKSTTMSHLPSLSLLKRQKTVMDPSLGEGSSSISIAIDQRSRDGAALLAATEDNTSAERRSKLGKNKPLVEIRSNSVLVVGGMDVDKQEMLDDLIFRVKERDLSNQRMQELIRSNRHGSKSRLSDKSSSPPNAAAYQKLSSRISGTMTFQDLNRQAMKNSDLMKEQLEEEDVDELDEADDGEYGVNKASATQIVKFQNPTKHHFKSNLIKVSNKAIKHQMLDREQIVQKLHSQNKNLLGISSSSGFSKLPRMKTSLDLSSKQHVVAQRAALGIIPRNQSQVGFQKSKNNFASTTGPNPATVFKAGLSRNSTIPHSVMTLNNEHSMMKTQRNFRQEPLMPLQQMSPTPPPNEPATSFRDVTARNSKKFQKILDKIERRDPTYEDKIAVKKLLNKHVPDYQKRYKYLQVGEFSDDFIEYKIRQQEEKENGKDAETHLRRKQLVDKFKELKEHQTQKCIKMCQEAEEKKLRVSPHALQKLSPNRTTTQGITVGKKTQTARIQALQQLGSLDKVFEVKKPKLTKASPVPQVGSTQHAIHQNDAVSHYQLSALASPQKLRLPQKSQQQQGSTTVLRKKCAGLAAAAKTQYKGCFDEFKRRESAISIDQSNFQERMLTSRHGQEETTVETTTISSRFQKTTTSNFAPKTSGQLGSGSQTAREPWVLNPGVNILLKQKILENSTRRQQKQLRTNTVMSTASLESFAVKAKLSRNWQHAGQISAHGLSKAIGKRTQSQIELYPSHQMLQNQQRCVTTSTGFWKEQKSLLGN